MRYAVISLVANTVGSIVLFFAFRALGLMPHLGIAVATTLGGWLNAGLLWSTLARRGEFVADARLKRALKLILIASAAMGVAVWAATHVLEDWFAAPGMVLRAGGLALLVGTGLLVYGAAILATGAVELRQLRILLGRPRIND